MLPHDTLVGGEQCHQSDQRWGERAVDHGGPEECLYRIELEAISPRVKAGSQIQEERPVTSSIAAAMPPNPHQC